MREREASLAALYGVESEKSNRALVSRHSPILRLDDNEPFRPLAAGYTIFDQDGPSPSINRHIRLRNWKWKASRVIEYAIWWDWDINHLYELEHVWVYLDDVGRIIRVEGSWHGEVKNLAEYGRVPLKDTHPLCYVAPGKHAFAPNTAHFQLRQAKIPGITTRFAGAMGIAINGLFDGEIQRSPPVDRLIHSYLARSAFEPSWNYSQTFTFKEKMLVPWAALRLWIPRRVQAWVHKLKQEISSADYRTLHIVNCSCKEDIYIAGEKGMDMVKLGIGRNRWGFPTLADAAGRPIGSNLVRLLQACEKARIGAYLVIHDRRVIPWLARLLRRKDWTDYLMTGASVPEWVALIKSKLPQYRTTLIMETSPVDVVASARSVGASYIHLTAPSITQLSTDWIKTIHKAELGIILTVPDSSNLTLLQRLGVEAILVNEPSVFGNQK